MLEFIKSFTGTAIIENNRSYSFVELYNRVVYYNRILEKYENANISVISDFTFESAALFLAFSINKNRNTFIPITPTSEIEINNKINISKTDFIFRFDHKNNNFKIENCKIEKSSFDSGVILFSSGTTGTPKMMLHKFSNLMSSFSNNTKRQRNIKILLFLMFDHIGGLNTFLSCLKDGSTIVIPKFRTVDHIVELIEEYEVNVLPTTPTFLNLLLIDIEGIFQRLKTLKLISYGTERMPQQVLDKLRLFLPNVKLLQTFGTSETGILRTISKSSDSLYFKIDDDRYEHKVVNSILYIRSKLNIHGYLNMESDKFDSDGWYETGDVIIEDSDGYMSIVGRINEVINVGGLKVMPIEIESILMTLNFIDDCLVYGEKNSITGQMVSAKIVLNGRADLNNYPEIELKKVIKDFCKTKLDKFKVPARIAFVDGLSVSSRFKKLLT
jgi:acyl-coenzyme A synthetase/AMP-(fatty) acid ligase